jgi:hypothetical protein
MAMSDHYRGGMTERLIVSIVTCDPATGRIEVVGKDAAVIQIGVKPVPVVFRWPKQGETWMIERVNGNWQLGPLVESPDSAIHVENIQPGEALIQAESLRSPSGERFLTTAHVQLPTYTVATLPSAAGLGGSVVYVSDGAAGAIVRVSNGTTWVNLG